MQVMNATKEVIHKLKCGQNIFRKPLIEKMVAEVVERVDVDELPQINLDYKSPVLSQEEKQKAEGYAKTIINNNRRVPSALIIEKLCIENVRLVKEINEHRAARGIDPLPTFEV